MSLEPSRDAVEVKGVIALTPGSVATCLHIVRDLGLAVDTRVHNEVPADGAVVKVVV